MSASRPTRRSGACKLSPARRLGLRTIAFSSLGELATRHPSAATPISGARPYRRRDSPLRTSSGERSTVELLLTLELLRWSRGIRSSRRRRRPKLGPCKCARLARGAPERRCQEAQCCRITWQRRSRRRPGFGHRARRGSGRQRRSGTAPWLRLASGFLSLRRTRARAAEWRTRST